MKTAVTRPHFLPQTAGNGGGGRGEGGGGGFWAGGGVGGLRLMQSSWFPYLHDGLSGVKIEELNSHKVLEVAQIIHKEPG